MAKGAGQQRYAMRDKEIVERYKTTVLKVSEIAAEFGLTIPRICQILIREGVDPSLDRYQRHRARNSDEVLDKHELVPRTPRLSPGQIEVLRNLHSQIPTAIGGGRAVSTSPQGRALVGYIAELRFSGYPTIRIAEDALQVTPRTIRDWLHHYGYPVGPASHPE